VTQTQSLADFLPFIAATDGLKHIERANRVVTGTRQENVAEHTWHTSLLALVFADAAPAGTDLNRVRDLLIAHDLVEIHAGDTVIWDDVPEADVAALEAAAAERLFALLPSAQRARFTAFVEEFADQVTIEARFARALDALHPMLMSWGADGIGHPNETLTPSRVLARKRPLIEEFPELWALAEYVVASAVERGLISPDPESDR
jgi:putative hydrolase of HD superfamily